MTESARSFAALAVWVCCSLGSSALAQPAVGPQEGPPVPDQPEQPEQPEQLEQPQPEQVPEPPAQEPSQAAELEQAPAPPEDEPPPAEPPPAEPSPEQPAPGEPAPVFSTPHPVGEEQPPPPPAPTAGLTPPPPPEPSPLRSLYVGAGPIFGVLNLPSLGVGVSLNTQVALTDFIPFEVSFSYFFENSEEVDRADLDLMAHPLWAVRFPAVGSEMDFNIFQVNASACPYEHDVSSGRLLVCAGMHGGVISGEGRGFVAADRGSTRGLFGWDAHVRWRFEFQEHFAFSYTAGIYVPLIRDRFSFVDRSGRTRTLFQAAPVCGRLDALFMIGF